MSETASEPRPLSLVVVGAGPAGLTAAWENARHGGTATVLERDALVGGIAESATLAVDAPSGIFFTARAQRMGF